MSQSPSPPDERADSALRSLEQQLNRIEDRISVGRAAASADNAEELRQLRSKLLGILQECRTSTQAHLAFGSLLPSTAIDRLGRIEQRADATLAKVNLKLQQA